MVPRLEAHGPSWFRALRRELAAVVATGQQQPPPGQEVEVSDCLGPYRIAHEGLPVTVAVERGSADVGKLRADSVVNVVEVRGTKEEDANRIRGRIEEPVGWISLMDTKSGHKWAVQVDEIGDEHVQREASSWSTRLRELVDLEWKEELLLVRERLEEWPLSRLVDEGLTLAGLRAEASGRFFGKSCVSFTSMGGDSLSQHDFRRGDQLIVTQEGEDPLASRLKARVLSVSREAVTCAMRSTPQGKGPWRLDRGPNASSYSRTLEGLASFEKGHVQAEVRRVLLELGDVALHNTSQEPLRLEDSGLSTLDRAQSYAVRSLETKRVGLIQGPPGCGKTHTACALLRAAYRGRPLLAVADSNVAVDRICGGLLALGVRAVRFGAPASITDDSLHSACVEVLLWEQGRSSGSQDEQDRLAEQKMIGNIFDGAEVVCSTIVGCGSEVFQGRFFDLVLLDEASQATEPRALIAISRMEPNTGRLVLVGDQQQLPPVCLSRRAAAKGLGLSLFDRLLRCPSMSPALLRIQYRMHPLIRQWPSDAFYGGLLIDGVTASQRLPVAGFRWPNVAAGGVAFFNSSGPEEVSPDGLSRMNREECALVRSVVDRLARHVPLDHIGVITPYRGQVRLLNSELDGWVETRTVDGYQGREKAIIIFSCVRSNPEGTVGFLSDPRRLNVALTRAQHGLIVVGNSATLRNDRHWRSWLHFVQANQLVVESPDVWLEESISVDVNS